MTVTAARARPDQMALCFDIRTAVFVDEQQIDRALEFDGLDDDAVHYQVSINGEMVGTARVRRLEADAKVERFAVLKSARKSGAGRALMDAIFRDCAGADGLERYILSAQDHAIAFYERLGFRCITDWYEEAGIPHRTMDRPA